MSKFSSPVIHLPTQFTAPNAAVDPRENFVSESVSSLLTALTTWELPKKGIWA